MCTFAQEGYKKPFEPLMPSAGFIKYNDMDSLDAIDEETCAVLLGMISSVHAKHIQFSCEDEDEDCRNIRMPKS